MWRWRRRIYGMQVGRCRRSLRREKKDTRRVRRRMRRR